MNFAYSKTIVIDVLSILPGVLPLDSTTMMTIIQTVLPVLQTEVEGNNV